MVVLPVGWMGPMHSIMSAVLPSSSTNPKLRVSDCLAARVICDCYGVLITSVGSLAGNGERNGQPREYEDVTHDGGDTRWRRQLYGSVMKFKGPIEPSSVPLRHCHLGDPVQKPLVPRPGYERNAKHGNIQKRNRYSSCVSGTQASIPPVRHCVDQGVRPLGYKTAGSEPELHRRGHRVGGLRSCGIP